MEEKESPREEPASENRPTPESPSKKPSAKKKKKPGKLAQILPVIGVLIGILILGFYPATELIDSWRRAAIVKQLDAQAEEYATHSQDEDTSVKDYYLHQARNYNQRLAGEPTELNDEDILVYASQLNPDKNQTAFGSVLIPALNLSMPLFHTTEDVALMSGVGHLEGTSLPIGGASTHTVVSAHSGMTGMTAFDELESLKVEDIFGIKIMGDIYAYQVYDIEVVEPHETDSLQIQPGEDIATLVTCTPYGINSHRLLVHGRRVEVDDSYFDMTPDVMQVVTSRRVWPFLLGLLILIILVITGYIHRKRQKALQKKRKEREAAARKAEIEK